MLQNKKAVIFDLDGTLVDSMWMWRAIDIEYLGRYGFDLPPTLQKDIEGMSFSETAAYFKNRFQIPDSIEEMKAQWNQMAWDKYEKEVPLKEGVMDFLNYCKEHDIKMGIATSNSKELVNNVLAAHGIPNYFSCIVTACEVEKGKPAPDVYLEASRRCQISPSKCLVFEDIVPGILAGKAAGMKVCAVEDAYSMDQKKEKEEHADYYIKNYTEIAIMA